MNSLRSAWGAFSATPEHFIDVLKQIRVTRTIQHCLVTALKSIGYNSDADSYDQTAIRMVFEQDLVSEMFSFFDIHQISGLDIRYVLRFASLAQLTTHFNFGVYHVWKTFELPDFEPDEYPSDTKIRAIWLYGLTDNLTELLTSVTSTHKLYEIICEACSHMRSLFYAIQRDPRYFEIDEYLKTGRLMPLSATASDFVKVINRILFYASPYTSIKFFSFDWRSIRKQTDIENQGFLYLKFYDPHHLTLTFPKTYNDNFGFFRSSLVNFGPMPSCRAKSFNKLPVGLQKELVIVAMTINRLKVIMPCMRDLRWIILHHVVVNYFRDQIKIADERRRRVKQLLETKSYKGDDSIENMCFDRFIDSDSERDGTHKYIHAAIRIVNHDMGLRIADPNELPENFDLPSRVKNWNAAKPEIKRIVAEKRTRGEKLDECSAAIIYIKELTQQGISLSTLRNKRSPKKRSKIE